MQLDLFDKYKLATDLTTKSEKLEVSPIIIELGAGIKENEVT